MSEPSSITQWFVDLKQGDENAAAQLWARYFERMIEAAQRKLGRCNHGAADAEDVALNAFNSLCRGSAAERFTQVRNRRDLWSLLLTLTVQESIDLLRREARQRRGGGKVRQDLEFPNAEQAQLLEKILCQSPPPEFHALLEEEHAQFLTRLRDDTLRAIVEWKLEGHTNAHIAELLGVSIPTVRRKLRLIHLTWLSVFRENAG
jgi:RNA polymerase sigma factor (sigma-70 family)